VSPPVILGGSSAEIVYEDAVFAVANNIVVSDIDVICVVHIYSGSNTLIISDIVAVDVEIIGIIPGVDAFAVIVNEISYHIDIIGSID